MINVELRPSEARTKPSTLSSDVVVSSTNEVGRYIAIVGADAFPRCNGSFSALRAATAVLAEVQLPDISHTVNTNDAFAGNVQR